MSTEDKNSKEESEKVAEKDFDREVEILKLLARKRRVTLVARQIGRDEKIVRSLRDRAFKYPPVLVFTCFPPEVQEYLGLHNRKLRSQLKELEKSKEGAKFDKKDLILMWKQAEHYGHLASLASVLVSNLSRGSKVDPSNGSIISWPIDEELEKGLLEHLQNEFPEFAKIDRWRNPATLRFVKINKEAFQILKQVSRRESFEGTCSICELFK